MEKRYRKNLRRKDHDYGVDAMYYITICINHHHCLFGTVQNNSMILNELGKIAHNQMSDLPDRYPGLQINNFIVMPNHVHAIFLYENIVNALMDTSVGAALAAAHTKITDIIGAYKSLVTVNILNYIKTNQENRFLGKLWQRSFFDTIIKDHDSYIRMFNYIEDNPSNWKNDEFYVIIK